MIASQGAPGEVRRAIACLWVAAALGIADALYLYTHPAPEIAEWAGVLLAIALLATGAYGVIIHLASRRRSWARHLLLALLVLGAASVVAFPADEPEPWWEVALVAVSFALEAVALYWLYTGAGARWYRERQAA